MGVSLPRPLFLGRRLADESMRIDSGRQRKGGLGFRRRSERGQRRRGETPQVRAARLKVGHVTQTVQLLACGAAANDQRRETETRRNSRSDLQHPFVQFLFLSEGILERLRDDIFPREGGHGIIWAWCQFLSPNLQTD